MANDTHFNHYSPQARQVAGVIAAIAFAALCVQPFLGEYGYLENAGLLLRFFTIWGNIAACILMGSIAFGKAPPKSAMVSISTMLTVIGGIYWIALANLHHPVGLDRIANQSHHTFVPIAFVLFWLRYTPGRYSTMELLPSVMVPPIAYSVFALVLGHFTGFYAYFFLDLGELGWSQYLINNVGLALFFAGLGAVLAKVRTWLRPILAEGLKPASSF